MDPLFIVGVPRSGTTLLVNLLGQHPLLAPIYETRFLRNLFGLCRWGYWYHGNSLSRKLAKIVAEPVVRLRYHRKCRNYRSRAFAYHDLPAEYRGPQPANRSLPAGELCIHYTKTELLQETDKWLELVSNGQVSSDEFCLSAKEYVDRLFAIHCSRMEKPYWINKTPGLLTHLNTLPLVYRKSRCLHIIRDGRDVAVSNLSLSWGPSTVRDAARRWKKLILDGRRKLDRRKLSYKEIRYEELTRSPEPVLNETFAFFGVGNSGLDEIVSRIPISGERNAVWRSTFSRQDRETFAREAGDLLIELGYENDYQWVR